MTVPETSTESPTATAGVADPVNTKIASLVAGSLSGRGSCTQKPRAEPKARTAVTVPGTPVTRCPASGDIRVLPWMSWIRTGAGGTAPARGAAALTAGGAASSPPASAVAISAATAAGRCGARRAGDVGRGDGESRGGGRRRAVGMGNLRSG